MHCNSHYKAKATGFIWCSAVILSFIEVVFCCTLLSTRSLLSTVNLYRPNPYKHLICNPGSCFAVPSYNFSFLGHLLFTGCLDWKGEASTHSNRELRDLRCSLLKRGTPGPLQCFAGLWCKMIDRKKNIDAKVPAK